MPTPLVSITNASLTADPVTGPGDVTSLVKGLPTALLGDAVAGAAVSGAVSATTAVNKLFQGRPAANLTAVVVGVNPLSGLPVTTALAVTSNVNIIY